MTLDGRPNRSPAWGLIRRVPGSLGTRLTVVVAIALLPACGLLLHLAYEDLAGTFHDQSGAIVEFAAAASALLAAVLATRFFAVRFVLEPIASLLRATQRVTAGDHTARARGADGVYEVGELVQLARSFDEMAAWLEARELQLEVEVHDRKNAEEAAQLEATWAGALARTASRLNAQLDLEAVLAAVCAETSQALRVSTVLVRLYDAQRDDLRVAGLLGLPSRYRDMSQAITRSHCDRLLAKESRVLTFPRLSASGLPDLELYRLHDLCSACIATMVRDGELVGTLAVASVGGERRFTPHDEAMLMALADEAATAIVNAGLFDTMQRRLEQTAALREIDKAIVGGADLGLVLRLVAEEAIRHVGAEAADVLLFNAQTRLLRFAAGAGFRRPAPQAALLSISGTHAGRVAQERRPVAISCLEEVPGPSQHPPWQLAEGFASYYGVPLLVRGEVKGVLELFHRSAHALKAEQSRFCDSLAAQAAVAIHNATLLQDLQRSAARLASAYDATIEGWSRALDLRDKETEGHTQRVTEMTLCLAETVGLSADELVQVRRGALLHDIGKMGVPDHILLKPGPLDAEEEAIMRRHPELAVEMLSPIEFLRPALEIPWCHHERWNGSGYPRGLRGEQIPLAARIFAVVDAWDALRSDRPYRCAWSEDDVRRHLQDGAGREFDPQAVEAFLSLGPNAPCLSRSLPASGAA